MTFWWCTGTLGLQCWMLLLLLERIGPSRSFLLPHHDYRYPYNVDRSIASPPLQQQQQQQQKEQSCPEQTTTNSSAGVFVGNLDWSLPARDCTDLLLGMLQVQVVQLQRDPLLVSIQIKPVNRQKVRDADKQHGGSATLLFATEAAAQSALRALLEHPATRKRRLKVRPAYLQAQQHEAQSLAPTPIPVTPERLLLRRGRAASYARRRRRAAARTDAVLDRVAFSVPQQQQRQSLPVLRADPLDWAAAPAVVDPARGGGLHHGSTEEDDDGQDNVGGRGTTNATTTTLSATRTTTASTTAMQRRATRKRAAVEAFLVVVQALLIGNGDDDNNIDEKRNHNANSAAIRIADLGCGAGNLALPLAWWLQQQQRQQKRQQQQRQSKPSICNILGVDLNGMALQRLDDRVQRLLLQQPNDESDSPATSLVTTLQRDILGLVGNPSFDSFQRNGDSAKNILADCAAIVSLHACGAASDLAILAAVQHGLPFAVSPCCIGKVNAVRTTTSTTMMSTTVAAMPAPSQSINRSAAPKEIITYPRSQWLQEQITAEEFQLLAKSADYGASESFTVNTIDDDDDDNDDENETANNREERRRRRRSRRAKLIVEEDRLQWARERGYFVRMLELPRIGPVYAKRELLLGATQGSVAARRIAELPVVSAESGEG